MQIRSFLFILIFFDAPILNKLSSERVQLYNIQFKLFKSYAHFKNIYKIFIIAQKIRNASKNWCYMKTRRIYFY